MILTDIPGTSFQLDAPAEASFERMKVDGCPGGITTAYRDAEYQQKLYDGWMEKLPGYNFALPPGQSKHELGTAVDVDRVTATWMAARGTAYGWDRPIGWNAKGIKNPEWWHFEYNILRDTKTFATPMHTDAGAAHTPPQLTQEEIDDMAATKGAAGFRDYQTPGNPIYLLYPNGTLQKLGPTVDVTAVSEAFVFIFGLPRIDYTNDAYHQTVQTQYLTQLSSKQANAFILNYPGPKFGF
jgi:hypothetical protein